MKKILILISFLALLVFSVGLSTGQDIRFVGRQNNVVDIREPCYNNGTYCSASAYCNISIWNPNQNIIISGATMDNNGAYHNYSLNTTQTSLIGLYEASITCTDNSLSSFNNYWFKLTPSGETADSGEATILLVILGVMVGFAAFFLVVAWLTQQDGVRLFFILLAFIMGILSTGTIRILLQYTSLSGGIINLVTAMIFIVTITFITIMFYVMVNQTKSAISLMKAKRGFGDLENENYF